jgi:hypothetical protein
MHLLRARLVLGRTPAAVRGLVARTDAFTVCVVPGEYSPTSAVSGVTNVSRRLNRSVVSGLAGMGLQHPCTPCVLTSGCALFAVAAAVVEHSVCELAAFSDGDAFLQVGFECVECVTLPESRVTGGILEVVAAGCRFAPALTCMVKPQADGKGMVRRETRQCGTTLLVCYESDDGTTFSLKSDDRTTLSLCHQSDDTSAYPESSQVF